MLLQHYEFEVADPRGPVYTGTTYFGYFTRGTLANQVGLRDAEPWRPPAAEAARGRAFEYPRHAPYPGDALRMVERIELFVPDGGPERLGFLRGTTPVDPSAWFFKAHFFQDPVVPGSLGLESFVQLLKVLAAERWGEGPFAPVIGEKHAWKYRGQVIPGDRLVTVEGWGTRVDEARRAVFGDGYLSVDGRTIYEMRGFGVRRA
jgi:3-hydroxymyristoyl/3-hydroxydecanoyl-(acyl carrier protein) dehydratase